MEPSIWCGGVAKYGTDLHCVACKVGTYSDTYGKISVTHVLCVQRGGQLNGTVLHRKIDCVTRVTMVTT